MGGGEVNFPAYLGHTLQFSKWTERGGEVLSDPQLRPRDIMDVI